MIIRNMIYDMLIIDQIEPISLLDLDYLLISIFLILSIIAVYCIVQLSILKGLFDHHKNRIDNRKSEIGILQEKLNELSSKLDNSISEIKSNRNLQYDRNNSIRGSAKGNDTPIDQTTQTKGYFHPKKMESLGSDHQDCNEEFLNKKIEENISKPIDLSPDNHKKDSNNKVLYLKAPDREKAFYAPEAMESPDNDSIYILRDGKHLMLNSEIKSSTINTIMASTDIYIKRACQIINAKESHHTRFEMVEPGEVIKEADDLIVTKKLKIKYI